MNIGKRLSPALRATLMLALLMPPVSCRDSSPRGLAPGNWNPVVHSVLDSTIRTLGVLSEGYDSACPPYAVFDFDNTTIIGDISYATLVYSVENLSLRIADPSFPHRILTAALPDPEVPLQGLEAMGSPSASALALGIERKWSSLLSKKDREGHSALSSDPMLRELLCEIWALCLGVDNTYDPLTSCIWYASLFSGFTPEEVRSLGKEAASSALSVGAFHYERVPYPPSGTTFDIPRGLALTGEMKDLFATLRDNGWECYICSATLEQIVEGAACGDVLDLGGIDKDHVFGIRLAQDSEGVLLPYAMADYEEPYREGKTRCIKAHMAPSHCGRGPAIVAGDSGGDVSMLTSFPSTLSCGLLLDAGSGGAFEELRSKALSSQGPYVLQGRDAPGGKFVSRNPEIH